MNSKKSFLLVVGFFAPLVAFAQGGTLYTVLGVMKDAVWQLGWILPILAFVVFFYGLARFVLSSGDAKKAEEGKGIMIWGLVAIFVLLSLMGIIGFLERTFGTDVGPGNVQIIVPTL
jgi:hypothetical protein